MIAIIDPEPETTSGSLSPAHYSYVITAEGSTAPQGGPMVRCVFISDENEPPSLAADF